MVALGFLVHGEKKCGCGRTRIENVFDRCSTWTIIFFFLGQDQTNDRTETTMGDITNQPLTVIGAQWCGYSQKQFTELGCSDTTSESETCKARFNEAHGGQPVNFVWCQDEKGQPDEINQDKPECKVEGVQGYPTWLKKEGDKFVESEHKGYKAPCSMADILDPTNLKCKEQQDAAAFCKQQMEAAQKDDKVKAAVQEVEKYQETVKAEMETKAKAVELAASSYMTQCKAQMEQAQPFK